MNSTVERVKQTIRGLPQVDVEELCDWIQSYKPSANERPSYSAKDMELLQYLKDRGVINEIVEPMTNEEDDEYQPIVIEGEPLSEIILRERR